VDFKAYEIFKIILLMTVYILTLYKNIQDEKNWIAN
jgi:hypothetical protein